ncbi:MAG TPA: glycosyltransferase family 39 protein [Candidatus Binatia bacterium]|nr:glycosyltransferase family 39 protein [Candidatus Binatia bacterium]
MIATEEQHQAKKSSRLEICDWIFLGVLLLAFVVRLDYFFITKDQPLWWDEAEYMLKAKALAFGTPETGWYKSRPVLLPFLAAGLFKLGGGEIAIRVLWIALSTISLILIYRIGAQLFNKRVGLYADALASFFYIDLFYSMRLLVDVPQVFFVVLAAYLLIRATYRTATYSAWAVLPVVFLGTAIRFTVGIFFIVAATFLIVVKRGGLWKDKRWLVSFAIGIALFLPFLLYYWAVYGNPLFPFVSQGVLRTAGKAALDPGHILVQYVLFFPNYTNIPVTFVFLAGFVLAAAVLARRAGALAVDKTVQSYLLALLWTLVPFFFFALVVDHFEDRYIAMIFPAVFLLTGAALDAGYEYLKRFSQPAAAAAVTLFLLYAAVSMALRADAVIADKLDSFAAIQDAGLWIKAHSQPGDSVLTSSVPQNTYYSERRSYAIPNEQEEFERMLAQRKPRYLVLSLWEQSPAWAYRWPAANPGKAGAVGVFFFDEERKRPAAIVYSLKD